MDYSSMILEANSIPAYYNLAAATTLWSILTGILVLPGTFTSLQQKEAFLQHIPLLPIAAFLCCLGIIGLSWLWFKFHKNYYWILSHLFLPGALNAFSGLISIFINVYTAKDHRWSPTAWVSLGVVLVSLCFMTIMSSICKWKLYLLKRKLFDVGYN
ncbi:hypothetical protein M406DRAFT_269836 [Cryphonectria parasitica EP155]|uniref:Uncharacterized protein n=1 Tax=Cryphonectria parasitica (strain ATCC 38755 / EP155) TaxID=660469 RepID=A0A9P4XSE3_CRYP1|nr:uncharacterized protein M406DRAFT_269836 [Cryphonectria parasitica EP155]KAF3760066.1 hypothetical protein M406DRAFT_269836 [Cryphonectria parasitica EP155]